MIDESYFPRTLRFDATWRCNLNCKHCQTGMFRGPDHPDDLTTEQLKAVIAQFADLGLESIGLLGGEPMLRKDLRELMEFFRTYRVHPTLNTNGVLLTKDWASYLIADARASITVSLDGASQETHEYIRGRGTWQRALQGVRHAVEARTAATAAAAGGSSASGVAQTGVSAVLHQRNVHEALEFLPLAEGLGVDRLVIAVVHRVGNAIRNWDDLALADETVWSTALDLARQLADYDGPLKVDVNFFTMAFRAYVREHLGIHLPGPSQLDQAGLFECYMQSDGRLFPSQKCSEIVPDVLLGAARELQITFRENSVLSHSVEDIWYGGDFSRYREMMTTKRYLATYDTCRNCKFSTSTCLPTAAAYLLDEEVPQPICQPALQLQ